MSPIKAMFIKMEEHSRLSNEIGFQSLLHGVLLLVGEAFFRVSTLFSFQFQIPKFPNLRRVAGQVLGFGSLGINCINLASREFTTKMVI